jgi:outer membrane murein-binding lipoprotein Lpp
LKDGRRGFRDPLAREDAQPDRIGIVGTPALSLGCATWLIIERKNMSPTVYKRIPAAVILVGAIGLGGCASKSYVREQIAPVSQRVDALESRLQETDGTAKAALAEAQAASGQAQNNGQRLDQLNGRVDGMEQRMQAQEKRGKRPRN